MVYAFIFGPVAVTVRYWQEHGTEVEGGARIEVRRIEPVTGAAHRPGAEGWMIGPVSIAGLWRSDLLTVISRPGNEPRYHHHPRFSAADVGERVFDPQLTADPVGWTMSRLADLPDLLADVGAPELADHVDHAEVNKALPAIRAAIEVCLEQMPRTSVGA